MDLQNNLFPQNFISHKLLDLSVYSVLCFDFFLDVLIIVTNDFKCVKELFSNQKDLNTL